MKKPILVLKKNSRQNSSLQKKQIKIKKKDKFYQSTIITKKYKNKMK